MDKAILIDTSILLEIDKIHLFDELKNFKYLGEPAITKQVLNELKSFINSNRVTYHCKKVANLALELIKKYNVKIIEVDGKDADESLLNAAIKFNYVVATNDEKLIKILKQKNIKVLRIRQMKKLELI
jgi:rRNA-processing protein FCF1